MARWQVLILYEYHEAFMKYDANIQDIIEDKFGEKGATDIQRYHMSPNFPLLLVTTFEAPDDVSLEELGSVKLGNGVAFDVQPNWE